MNNKKDGARTVIGISENVGDVTTRGQAEDGEVHQMGEE